MVEPNMLYKIFQRRLLTEDNIDNDYYFIRYLAYILKYTERKNYNRITYFGLKSIELNIMPIYTKLVNEFQEEKVTQNELIKFCLYMSNANKICEEMKNVITLYKQDKNGFRQNSKLPDCVLYDFIRFEDRIYKLSIMFNKIAEEYSDCLGTKHKYIYNQDKTISFLHHNTIIQ